MNDDQINELIELSRFSPDMAKTAQELGRLAGLADDVATRNILTQIMRGYLSCATDPCEPLFEPVEIVGGQTHMGVNTVGPVNTVNLLGYPTAFWRCRSFMHRMRFLYTGVLAVAYSVTPIPALCLRLDVEQLGFQFVPDEK